MKQTILFILTIFLVASCSTTKPVNSENFYSASELNREPLITQSLFADNNSTISEDNIQKILDGTYKLPEKLRVAIVKLESKQYQQKYYWTNTNEDYLKTQQAYLDILSEKFKNSQRVEKIFIIPDLLISNNPTFLNIRESAIRMQTDVVAIFSINSEIYTKHKAFTSPDIKAFATTQFILLDVRTGLIPFSTIITKDYQSKKSKTDFDDFEVRNRVKNEAVLLTLNEIGEQLIEFLNNEK